MNAQAFPNPFKTELPADEPVIVSAQVGNVNSGAFDDVGAIADIVHTHDAAWLHVDGAFGLWARAVPELRDLADGLEKADSWASDMHKWLNVPYDSGLVIVRDREAHRVPMTLSAAYLTPARADEHDPQSGRLFWADAAGGARKELLPDFQGHFVSCAFAGPEALLYLADRGCEAVQGFLFAEPLAEAAYRSWLAD